jgi:hypothetical protein
MNMRRVREITAEEENFHLEDMGVPGMAMIKRDPIEPEPVGTFILMAFRVTGYDKDCDGSLMARLDQVEFKDPKENTGWEVNSIGLYPETDLVVTEEELKQLYLGASPSIKED